MLYDTPIRKHDQRRNHTSKPDGSTEAALAHLDAYNLYEEEQSTNNQEKRREGDEELFVQVMSQNESIRNVTSVRGAQLRRDAHIDAEGSRPYAKSRNVQD